MNFGPAEAARYFETVGAAWGSRISEGTTLAMREGRLCAALMVPAITLERAQEARARLPIQIGAQNAHWEKSGAFTGELSGPMLQELGIEISLTGHSERRQYFGETDLTAHKRTLSLLQQGFKVIACIGETRQERESSQTFAVLERQLRALLNPASPIAQFCDGRLVLAYEPVWAIGTGITATPEQAQDVHAWIRSWLGKSVGDAAAQRTSVLYGGSVTPENIASLLGCADIDGALIGGASLKPDGFLSLLEAGAK